MLQVSAYGEEPIPFEGTTYDLGEPEAPLRVAALTVLGPGRHGDLALKSAQTVLLHLQTRPDQGDCLEQSPCPKHLATSIAEFRVLFKVT